MAVFAAHFPCPPEVRSPFGHRRLTKNFAMESRWLCVVFRDIVANGSQNSLNLKNQNSVLRTLFVYSNSPSVWKYEVVEFKVNICFFLLVQRQNSMFQTGQDGKLEERTAFKFLLSRLPWDLLEGKATKRRNALRWSRQSPEIFPEMSVAGRFATSTVNFRFFLDN